MSSHRCHGNHVTNNADITDKKIHHSGYDALQFGPKWLTGYVCRKG